MRELNKYKKKKVEGKISGRSTGFWIVFVLYLYMCVYGIQNKKQTSFNISMFIFIFQIKSWPKYNGIGSHDLCAPISFAIKLRKTTKDHRCWKIQFNLGPGCSITPFSPRVSRRSLGTGAVRKSLEALTISVLK